MNKFILLGGAAAALYFFTRKNTDDNGTVTTDASLDPVKATDTPKPAVNALNPGATIKPSEPKVKNTLPTNLDTKNPAGWTPQHQIGFDKQLSLIRFAKAPTPEELFAMKEKFIVTQWSGSASAIPPNRYVKPLQQTV